MARLNAAIILVLAVAAACGGGYDTPSQPSSSTPPVVTMPPAPAAPPPPPTTAQITITPTGVTPKEVTIAKGGIVTFANDDVRGHDVFSDPDHAGTDCPAINTAGFILAGQRRETAPLTIVRSCGYHDHLNTNDQSMRGTIIVVDVP